MADLLEQGAAWLEEMRLKHASRPVTYVRGAASVEVQATVGRTVFELRDEFGLVEKTETRDFLVRTAELVLGGEQTLPRRGDQVREAQGDKVFVYEVMAPGKEPEWRWSDFYRRTLRIHTKQVGTEEAP